MELLFAIGIIGQRDGCANLGTSEESFNVFNLVAHEDGDAVALLGA